MQQSDDQKRLAASLVTMAVVSGAVAWALGWFAINDMALQGAPPGAIYAPADRFIAPVPVRVSTLLPADG